MAIGNAVERDQFVYVYDEKGYQLSTLFVGNGPEDGLKGLHLHHGQCQAWGGYLHI
jgi:hypothetical protein